ncbi:hypothetical protein N7499_011023 [Penicillium canescens]|nr:hypothetical protein N7499_011023 [Penicillium canescens]
MSFFMFGVDNFKRDPNEIEDIMKIINDKVGKWVAPGGLAHRLEVCLSHCGERDMLEPDLLGVLDYAMDITKNYRRTKDLSLEATRRILTHNLWTKDDPSLDIIIRTSGETRLSDYMLWQCCENTQLNFINCFWPEIRVWHLARIVLGWRMGRTF